MKPKNMLDSKSSELEDLYIEYFAPEETPNDIDETQSLVQPSALKYVDSFTTSGTVADLPIDQG